jgi:hypothetical protein
MLKRILLTTAILLATAGSSAGAQILRGKIVDDKRAAIRDVTVRLADAQGQVVRVALSDDLGVFHLPSGAAGIFVMEAQRIGFAPWRSAPLRLVAGETLEIEVRMGATVQTLPQMTITRRSNREWGRDGFAERSALGQGVFLTGREVAMTGYETIAEVLGDVEGLRTMLHPFPHVLSNLGHRCLRILLNRVPLPVVPGELREETLHRHLGPERVAGIEVYREFSEVPVEFQHVAWEDRLDSRRVSIGNMRVRQPVYYASSTQHGEACGVVNVWTRRAW